jgi:hypothetical protein
MAETILSPEKAISELAEIYNTYRNAALNKDYYGKVLERYQTRNTILEILIAIGATSSGISGLALWQVEPHGKIIWASITAVSGVLAVIKPFLQMNKKIERYSRLFSGHLENYLALGVLVAKIRRKRALTEELVEEYELAERRFIELSRDDEPNPNVRIHRECEEAIRVRIPDEILWLPPRDSQPTPAGTVL